MKIKFKIITNNGLAEREGNYFPLAGYSCAIHKEEKEFTITELTTGFRIAHDVIKEEAIISAQENMEASGKLAVEKAKQYLASKGISYPINNTKSYGKKKK